MRIIEFKPSAKKNKKIDAVVEDNGKKKIISFGQKGSVTYSNKTGVKVDSTHNDSIKKKAYLARHKGEDSKMYSPGWFAIKYLWS